ncbi:ECF transporter S component [Oceanobacillus massiliensis]|uniref:ECF transporter S component n=1 Tax=Oceanobacillus massiliensis TaxID=1465765 RepID=UPI0002889D7D|nr:ECF transporter S component [Oceanobacillus massiliensis]
MNTYKITIIALLAAMAIAGRFIFQFIPNVQPVTSLIIICGIILGPFSAFLLAILTAFLSNMLMGMGIWTLWQIISWSIIGLLSGILGRLFKRIPLPAIILFAIFSGYLYGFILSLTNYQFTGMFWPYYLAGLPFDTSHAIGNAVFIVLLYPLISHLFHKYADQRFTIKNTS